MNDNTLKSKKTALMTWYSYPNYGTALQAFALQHVIINLGYENEIICYTPKNINLKSQKGIRVLFARFRRKIDYLLNTPYLSPEQINKFRSFTETELIKSPILFDNSDEEKWNSMYDAFVCGSDQIWSPVNYDSNYFLSFVKNKSKIIAYAPSIGTPFFKSNEIKEKMSKDISCFKYLSVRESSGVKIIKDICGKDATLVVDPTLLISRNEWLDILCKRSIPIECNEQYILCYFLGNAKQYENYVNRISSILHMPVIIIPMFKQQYKSKCVIKNDIDPLEFVSLFANAAYVCTDSYHGVLFSVNFHKRFTAFKRFKDNSSFSQNTRLYSFLKLVGLETRIVDKAGLNDMCLSNINYRDVESNLMKAKRASLSFLKESLLKATSESNI
jgi:hypothetical protein